MANAVKWKIKDLWKTLKNIVSAVLVGELLLRLNIIRYFPHFAYLFLLFWLSIWASLATDTTLNKVEQNDVLLISSIVGVKATNIFIKKIRQNKSIEAKDFLNDFDSKVPLLANLSLHQFTILNEDIFSFIESRYDSFTKTAKCED